MVEAPALISQLHSGLFCQCSILDLKFFSIKKMFKTTPYRTQLYPHNRIPPDLTKSSAVIPLSPHNGFSRRAPQFLPQKNPRSLRHRLHPSRAIHYHHERRPPSPSPRELALPRKYAPSMKTFENFPRRWPLNRKPLFKPGKSLKTRPQIQTRRK